MISINVPYLTTTNRVVERTTRTMTIPLSRFKNLNAAQLTALSREQPMVVH
jgi:hypothetical protein